MSLGSCQERRASSGQAAPPGSGLTRHRRGTLALTQNTYTGDETSEGGADVTRAQGRRRLTRVTEHLMTG